MKIFNIAITVLCLMSSAAMAEGKRYAVLVGVEDYEHSQLQRLQFSVDDVTDLAAVLKQSGYTVTLLTDETGKKQRSLEPTRANIEKQIQTVLDRCRKDDTVILAFAGHGLQFTGQKDAYFCPVDGRPYADKSSSLVSISKIYSELEKSLAGVKVIFVDACRNDPDPGRGRGGLNADAVPPPPRGVAALFSCSAGQRAFEHNELKHGVFFHYVLEGFKSKAVDNDGEVTFSGLSLYVRKNVPRRVRQLFPEQQYDQFPNLRANLVGIPPVLARVQDKPKNGFANSKIFNSTPSKLMNKKSEPRKIQSLGNSGNRSSKPPRPMEENLPESVKNLWTLANSGDVISQNELGVLYRTGQRGVKKDEKMAVYWYRRAADKGYAVAQYNMGFILQHGHGLTQNYAEAVRWYEKAIAQGDEKAMNNLGVMYQNGHGVPQNDKKAFELYEESAGKGHMHARNNLGYFYDVGRGVKEDDFKAQLYYRLAANQGFAMAQCNLGIMYENGTGVVKSIDKAIYWYEKAAAQGYQKAKDGLKRLGK